MSRTEEQIIGAKLNISHILQSAILGICAWGLYTTQKLSENIATSASERAALKEDIRDLKAEVKDLRVIVYTALAKNYNEAASVKK